MLRKRAGSRRSPPGSPSPSPATAPTRPTSRTSRTPSRPRGSRGTVAGGSSTGSYTRAPIGPAGPGMVTSRTDAISCSCPMISGEAAGIARASSTVSRWSGGCPARSSRRTNACACGSIDMVVGPTLSFCPCTRRCWRRSRPLDLRRPLISSVVAPSIRNRSLPDTGRRANDEGGLGVDLLAAHSHHRGGCPRAGRARLRRALGGAKQGRGADGSEAGCARGPRGGRARRRLVRAPGADGHRRQGGLVRHRRRPRDRARRRAGGKAESREGALATLAGTSFGAVLLVLLAVGFAAYASGGSFRRSPSGTRRRHGGHREDVGQAWRLRRPRLSTLS